MKLLRARAGADSGQITAFRPAQRTKPPSFLQRFINALQAFRSSPAPEETTQQGTPGSASPATYQQSLWALRYERQQYIADCNEIVREDCRIRRSLTMYVYEAVRGGYKIKVDGGGSLSAKAQKLADGFMKLTPTSLLEEWGRSLLTEGDLFVQAVCRDTDLLGLLAMPAVSMERLSDDADQIIDPARAFEQVDVTTWQTIAPFPLALMTHVRWEHGAGQRYGTPELLASRRPWRILKLMEESAAVRRMVRSPMRIHFKVGDPASGATGTEQDIEKFKADNGFTEGSREIFDPTEVATNYFSNGLVSVEPIEGDSNIDKIDDIRHMQNVLGSTLPTPAVLFGNDAESVNRDVVEDLRAEWLKNTERLNEALDQVIRFAFDLTLMLQGIDPDLVSYSVIWSTSSIEKPSEVIDGILATYKEGLCSKLTAVTRLQQYMGFEDVDAELAAIEAEQKARRDEEFAKREQEIKLHAASEPKKLIHEKPKKTSADSIPVLNGNGHHRN